ncbi:PH domain-containing protein [Lentilactobacillus hilgardii]|uniref:PH domain-containing protein n=1 Tax=Lentilactobacillus hilgardii TaxID=1588 RepID=UPI0039E79857
MPLNCNPATFSKKLVSIPIARVQDVTLSAGPILQSQKLQTVQITTASTSHKIDGLEPQTAEQLRRQIMQLAVEVKENDV